MALIDIFARQSTMSLNRVLVASLARLTNDSTLRRYAESWDPARLNLRERAEFFGLSVDQKREPAEAWDGFAEVAIVLTRRVCDSHLRMICRCAWYRTDR